MHKFFAKTLFLGKNVIFLPECHSTNDYLLTVARERKIVEGAVVWTDYQDMGRGQRGNVWISDRGQNLLGSLLIKPTWLPLNQQYLLTVYTAVAIREALHNFTGMTFSIKWPNDIFIENKKVAGILCECAISGNLMENAVLGFGVNVNQKYFQLPSATSLAIAYKQDYNREELLEQIIVSLERWYHVVKAGKKGELLEAYFQYLLGLNQTYEFEVKEGCLEGCITGIDEKGYLKVKVTGTISSAYKVGKNYSFGIKEIRMII